MALPKLLPLGRILFSRVGTMTRFTSTNGMDVLRVYEAKADETLERLADYASELGDNSSQDVDISLSMGVLSIAISDTGTFVINKQRPNLQLWLSSPISGPRRYDLASGSWVCTREGKLLQTLLNDEFAQIFRNTKIDFSRCMFFNALLSASMGDNEDEKNDAAKKTSGNDDDLASPSRKRRAVESQNGDATPSGSRRLSGQTYNMGTSIDSSNIIAVLKAENLAPIEQLELMHKICTDSSFRIRRAPENPIERIVKENVRRAFWDLLKQDVSKIPPEFQHAIQLILEAKQILLEDLLPPRPGPTRREVEAKLDENSIRNEIEQGSFDVSSVASFVIDILSKLCAPQRDDEVARLRSHSGDIVQVMRGIMETMDGMKDDMLSFLLESRRSEVTEAAREYERKELAALLTDRPQLMEEAVVWTRQSYDRVRGEDEGADDGKAAIRATAASVVRLLRGGCAWPVHWIADKAQLMALAEKRLQLVVVAASLYAAKSTGGFSPYSLNTLRDHFILLSNDVDNDNLLSVLEGIELAAVKKMDEEIPENSDEKKEGLRVIRSLNSSENPMRKIIDDRFDDHMMKQLLFSEDPEGLQAPSMPAALCAVEKFIDAVASRLQPLLHHNYVTHFNVYQAALRIPDACN